MKSGEEPREIMRSSLAAGLIYTGTILLSFGLAVAIIQLLGARYGARNETAVLLGWGVLAAGAVLWGAGFFMRRSTGDRRGETGA